MAVGATCYERSHCQRARLFRSRVQRSPSPIHNIHTGAPLEQTPNALGLFESYGVCQRRLPCIIGHVNGSCATPHNPG
eukprot:4422490-Prymnesium_polylepis.2